MRTTIVTALVLASGLASSLAARGESLAAFDGRCILAGCVAPPSNTPGILGRRALPSRRLARLGATPDFHHGLLALEADLETQLAVLGVVERSEERRARVGLDVGRQKGIQRVVGAYANPWLEAENLEAVLDAELQPQIGREPAAFIAEPDEVERVIDGR